MKRARFLEPAEAEINDAVVYLDAQRPGVGQRFGNEVERAIEVIGKYPDIGAPLTDRFRRFRLRTFPYDLVYFDDVDELLVVAVAHHKRRPGYWRARIS